MGQGVIASVTPGHVYVHAPFCARRCSYCDFAVTVDARPPAEAWLTALSRELDGVMGARGWPRLQLDTIYVGGGTPSLFGVGAMGGLATVLGRKADWDAGAVEWTAEANPERFDQALAEDWLAAGVNRLSMGAQTFDPDILVWMGRLHGADGPGKALAAARGAGFENISIDLIFGLPERFARDWAADLDRALELNPDHVSLYGLTAEAATPLGRWVAEGREQMPREERYEEEYLLAAERLTGSGYVHYEVSNFARPGRESRHNGAYWMDTAWIGLGPGAHSSVPPERWWNVRDWAEYRARLNEGRSPVEDRENVTREGRILEDAWLGLRTRSGVRPANPAQRDLLNGWVSRGLAEHTDTGATRLTANGWLVLDTLAVTYAEASHRQVVGTDRF
jgi:oxygen-independent coproporphyrinogen-3 oxidase